MEHTMNCNEIREHLSAYIDDELDSELAQKVETHLFRCFECAKLFQETGNMALLLLKQVETVPVPTSFDRKLRIALREEKDKQTTGRNKKKLAMISSVAAVFVIGIFSILMFNMGGNDDGRQVNNEAPVTLAMGDYEIDPNEMMRAPLATWGFDDEDLDYAENESLDDEYIDEEYLEEEDYIEEEMEEYPLDEEEVYEETDAQVEYAEPAYEAVAEATYALLYGYQAETEQIAEAPVAAPAATTIEHYLNLVSNRLSGYEHRIISYSFDEGTGIFTIRAEVVVAVGVQTEVRTFRGQHGNIWPVIVE